MDNKTAFAIAGSVFRALVKAKAIKTPKEDNKELKQLIFAAVQVAPIKEQKTDDEKKEQEIEGFELSNKLATDPVFARGWLIQRLATSVEAGNAQAAKEVRDILKIASNEDGLALNILDFREMCEGCPKLESPPIVADLAE